MAAPLIALGAIGLGFSILGLGYNIAAQMTVSKATGELTRSQTEQAKLNKKATNNNTQMVQGETRIWVAKVASATEEGGKMEARAADLDVKTAGVIAGTRNLRATLQLGNARNGYPNVRPNVMEANLVRTA